MLTVACVLKSGGDYSWEYVYRLRENIQKYLSYEYKFVCLTDVPNVKFGLDDIMVLESDLKSYWAKLEMFRLKGEVIYFDLDTIILKDLNSLIEGVRTMASMTQQVNNFFMMKAFNRHRRYASGIMAWTGDYSSLYRDIAHFPIDSYGKWEQDYIVDRLLGRRDKIHFIDDCLGGGIVSYKHHCQNEIPAGANIICFHGEPRPRDVGWLEEKLVERK